MKNKKILIVILLFGLVLLPNINAKAKVNSYDELAQLLAPNGEVSINAVKSIVSDKLTVDELSNMYFNIYYYELYSYLTNCNEDLSVCDLSLYTPSLNEAHDLTPNVRQVKVNWASENDNAKKIVGDAVNDILKNSMQGAYEDNIYVLEDLDYVNYMYMREKHPTSSDSSNSADYYNQRRIDYITKFNNITKYANVTALAQVKSGDANVIYSMYNSSVAILYDGVIYDVLKENTDRTLNIYTYFTMYIPDETENSKDAYMKVAQERLDKYFGKGEVTIGYGGILSNGCSSIGCANDQKYTNDQIGGNYYTLTIGDYTYPYFLIVRDSSKMQDVDISSKDYETQVSVKVKDSFVPRDTYIKVEKVEQDSDDYSKIEEKLATPKFIAYDISLYSDTLKENITTITNGSFEVSIPVPEELKNENLIVYYIKEDGSLEEHTVTVKDNYATFTTNHFSQYILAATNKTETPVKPDTNQSESSNNAQTGTINTILYIIVTILSLGGIIGLTVYNKKRVHTK